MKINLKIFGNQPKKTALLPLFFLMAMSLSCSNARIPNNELPENADSDFVFSNGQSMSTDLADEHHPVMLGNHFYYVADVIATGRSFVHHAKLLPDGTFQDLGRLQNSAGTNDLRLDLLGLEQTNACQIAGQDDYWDMHGVTMNDGKSYLIFGRRIIPANDGKNGMCILPLDPATGEIVWAGAKLVLLSFSADTSTVNCAKPVGVGYVATKLNKLGVFLNYEGLSSSALKFAVIDYNTGSGVQTGGPSGGPCPAVGKSIPAYLTPPAPLFTYQTGDKAMEVRSVTVNNPDLPNEVNFQIVNNSGRLQIFGLYNDQPLKLDIFDQRYYDCCFINSPSIGPDKRFYFAAKHKSNPDFPTMDLYRIKYPTVDEMKPAHAMVRYLLTGERPAIDVALP